LSSLLSVARLCVIAGTGMLAAACAPAGLQTFNLDTPAQTLTALNAPVAVGGRQRFREIFCELLRQRGAAHSECERRLHRLADEPISTSAPVNLPSADPKLVVLVIPGLFGQCVAELLEPFHLATRRLETKGYRFHQYLVPGVSSAEVNAARIAAAFDTLALDPKDRVVVLAHSKGAVDTLRFLVDFPDQASQVTAVVSVAGAINGSLLADGLGDLLTEWSREVTREFCDPGDLGAYESLKRRTRLTWLARNPLPARVRYYSVAAFAPPEKISAGLWASYEWLATIDPRNDGMLLFYDQVIPGATLMGYANADHWAIAYPVSEVQPQLGHVATQNDYPREVLLEAILLYLSEDLRRSSE